MQLRSTAVRVSRFAALALASTACACANPSICGGYSPATQTLLGPLAAWVWDPAGGSLWDPRLANANVRVHEWNNPQCSEHYLYDSHGRLERHEGVDDVGDVYYSVAYEWENDCPVASVETSSSSYSHPGSTWELTCDDHHQPISYVSNAPSGHPNAPTSETWENAYDADEHLTHSDYVTPDRTGSLDFFWIGNHLTGTVESFEATDGSDADRTSLAWTYAQGRLSAETRTEVDASGTTETNTSWTYDGRGRPLKRREGGGTTATTTYSYDPPSALLPEQTGTYECR